MTVKATKLKSTILKSGKKVGILVADDSPVDHALTSSTKVAADLINDGKKQAGRIAREAKSTLDELRAKIHAATAPQKKKR